MAQAVSRWPLTAEARVRTRVNPCGICGGQSGTGQVFSEYFVFPCKYHSTIAPYSSITAPWGVRSLWPRSTLSQPRSSVRGFTSDPAHWLETENRKLKKNQSYWIACTSVRPQTSPLYFNVMRINAFSWTFVRTSCIVCTHLDFLQ
jgi:hypothetical protein